MAQLALVVEDVFLVPALGGLVFTPDAADGVEPGDYDAELMLPDGSSRRAVVRIDWVHFSPIGFRLVCRALGVTKAEVPVGTQIWIDEPRRVEPDVKS